MAIRLDKEDMYAFEIGLEKTSALIFEDWRVCHAYRLLSSSFLIIHSDLVLLHWVHSVSPSGTTQRIRLSRQDAQATDAL